MANIYITKNNKNIDIDIGIYLIQTLLYFPFRSCSGLIVTSYSKDDKNFKMFEKQLRNLSEQYNIFKKNLDLNFDLCEREELKGLFIETQSTTIISTSYFYKSSKKYILQNFCRIPFYSFNNQVCYVGR